MQALCTESMHADVVVIGAGAAGVGAVTALLEHNPQLVVVVLEAKDRIGGRAHTIADFGYPMDLGCQWFHNCPDNLLFKWASSSRQNTDHVLKCPADEITVFKADSTYEKCGHDLDAMDEAMAMWKTADQHVQFHAGQLGLGKNAGAVPEDFGVGEIMMPVLEDNGLLTCSPMVNAMVQSQINSLEEVEGGPFESMSIHCKFGNDAGGYNEDVACGYGALVKAYAEAHGFDKCQLHLLGKVFAVEEDEDKLAVSWTDSSGETQQVRAARVISCVPAAVLQSESITISPPLPPSFANRLQTFGVATFEKVVLEFSMCFGQDVGCVACIAAGRERQDFQRFVNWSNRCGGNVWLGYTAPCYARRMMEDNLEDETILASASQVFAAAFPGLGITTETIVRHHITRWCSDEFAQGSYACSLAGCTLCPTIDEDPLTEALCGGRLFLAGDYLAGDYVGSCHGALLSGQHAAARAMAD